MSYKIVESENIILEPYCVISDVHCHNWSAFSHINVYGINSRLQHILDGIREAVEKLANDSGRDLIITGDLFHTRGNVKPSVLNAVYDLFREICSYGIRIHIIPGNHDLEGKNSERLGNAITVLSEIDGVTIYNEPTMLKSNHLFIPWIEDSQEVLKLARERSYLNPNLTLFAHVGMNGVVPGHIGNTINPEEFLKEKFKYVFCGHFHNHVNFDSRVYSVGALTHQTWNDVGSRAGYLIVNEKGVSYYPTKAPRFLDLDFYTTYSEPMIKGNYVRMVNSVITKEDAETFAANLKGYGALAVLDQTSRPTLTSKAHSVVVKTDTNINEALESYCKHTFGERWEEVLEECLKLTN